MSTSRCARLNQACGYTQVVHPPTRHEQLRQLQERLERTEAQLALSTIKTPQPSLPSMTPSSIPSRHEIQPEPSATPYSQVLPQPAPSTVTSGGQGVDPGNSAGSLFDVDIFNTLNDGTDTEMMFDLTSEPLEALEPLENLLLHPNPAHVSSRETPDKEIPLSELRTLHDAFFETVYFSFPFINKDRFLSDVCSSTQLSEHALVYAVALSGFNHPTRDTQGQALCYDLARSYAERCERRGDIHTISFVQALVLIGRFEAIDRRLELSWLTLGRASLACQLLNLAQMDQPGNASQQQGQSSSNGCQPGLPQTDNPVVLEERRRTFWALYVLQSYVRTRAGWPCQLGDAKVTDN